MIKIMIKILEEIIIIIIIIIIKQFETIINIYQ